MRNDLLEKLSRVHAIRKTKTRPSRWLMLFCLGAMTPWSLGASARPEGCQRFEQGQRDEHVYSLLLEARSISGTQSCVPLYTGLLERDSKNLSRAIATLRRGLEDHPAHMPLLLELAVTLSWEGQLESALSTYRNALSKDPDSRPAHLGEARILSWMGKKEDAELRYRSMLSENGDDVGALLGIAFLRRSELRLREAKGLYRRALDLEPSNVEAAEGLALAEETDRWQLNLSSGKPNLNGTTQVRSSAMEVRYHRRPRSFLTLAFSRDALEFSDPLLQGSTTQESLTEQLRLGGSIGAGANGTAALSIESRRNQQSLEEQIFVGFSYAHRLSEQSSLFSDLRLGDSNQSGSVAVASLGWSLIPLPRQEFVLQAFASNADFGSGAALLARWSTELPASFRLRLGMTLGNDPLSSFTAGDLTLLYEILPAVELKLHGQIYNGIERRDSLSVGLSLQF